MASPRYRGARSPRVRRPASIDACPDGQIGCGQDMERYPELPPLPARIRRLEELACDLWWSWHYRARDVFRRLDYPLWRLTAHNPVRMLRLMPRERLAAAADDPSLPRVVRQRDPRARPCADRARHLVGQPLRAAGQRRADRLLLGRVRAAPVAADLRRAASACSPATSARKRATSGSRWSASGSCTRRATSTSTSRPKAGSRRRTSG